MPKTWHTCVLLDGTRVMIIEIKIVFDLIVTTKTTKTTANEAQSSAAQGAYAQGTGRCTGIDLCQVLIQLLPDLQTRDVDELHNLRASVGSGI